MRLFHANDNVDGETLSRRHDIRWKQNLQKNRPTKHEKQRLFLSIYKSERKKLE